MIERDRERKFESFGFGWCVRECLVRKKVREIGEEL
jgi:hypothetical protein